MEQKVRRLSFILLSSWASTLLEENIWKSLALDRILVGEHLDRLSPGRKLCELWGSSHASTHTNQPLEGGAHHGCRGGGFQLHALKMDFPCGCRNVG